MARSTLSGRLADALRWSSGDATRLASFYRFLAQTALVIAALCMLLWIAGRGDERAHGGAFAFLTAAWVAPIGVSFWVASIALRRGARPTWAYEALPLVAGIIWSKALLPVLGLG